ncbi:MULTISPECIES: hypothetical protein [Thermoactinomyces]|uniref:Uncharacterized protein n=1 Tax=Thermoactinomyces daqus TaxID=1329516 RepID=A0A7W1XC58_9BACL|nr:MULTISPECIES: hypothetical protein [Thermoactinomyces]MBA4543966.1 hypothetical protein [Thermoactinomyces daqus]MBH8599100.1 hypothetical protein [Thermoactinomyces sp. CICC 10523]MBH8607968.1 hypothetical protein [Thermoactinomyces sp. CICC 10521]
METNYLRLPEYHVIDSEQVEELERIRIQILQALDLGHTEAIRRILDDDLVYTIRQIKQSV